MPSDWFLAGLIGNALAGAASSGAAAAAPAAAGAAAGAAPALATGAAGAGLASAAPALASTAATAAPSLAASAAPAAGAAGGGGGGILGGVMSRLGLGGAPAATTSAPTLGAGGTGAGTGAGVGPLLPSTPTPSFGELTQPSFPTGSTPQMTPYAASGSNWGAGLPSSMGEAGGMLKSLSSQGARFMVNPLETAGPLGQFTQQLSPQTRAILTTLYRQRGRNRQQVMRQYLSEQIGSRWGGSAGASG